MKDRSGKTKKRTRAATGQTYGKQNLMELERKN
jgi:hypothetical protein